MGEYDDDLDLREDKRSEDSASGGNGSGPFAGLMGLQGSAGNQAVSALLGSGGSPYADPGTYVDTSSTGDEASEGESQEAPVQKYTTFVPDATSHYKSLNDVSDWSGDDDESSAWDDSDELSGLEDEIAAVDLPEPTPYPADVPMQGHADESTRGSEVPRLLWDSITQAVARSTYWLGRRKRELAAKFPGFSSALVQRRAAASLVSEPVTDADRHEAALELMVMNTAWSRDEIQRHIIDGEPFLVTYLAEDQRKEYVLEGGPSFTIGAQGRKADTSAMWSKAAGNGWGIFVMDGSGNLYAEAHKMGMFHHSSFMAGGNVAAAGEIRIHGGKVTGLTNKSGHYVPTVERLLHVVKMLKGRGVAVAGLELHLHSANAPKPEVTTGADFLARYGA